MWLRWEVESIKIRFPENHGYKYKKRQDYSWFICPNIYTVHVNASIYSFFNLSHMH